MLTTLMLLLAVKAPETTVTVRATGDVMLGTTVPEGFLPPADGAESLSDVAADLRDADLTFVNLEGPMCDEGETTKCRSPRSCYAFRVPTRYGAYLADAGVDVVSTANNHAGDFGDSCRRVTEQTLDQLGIAWSGPKGTVATLERKGLKIGVVAFHTSGAVNDVNDLEGARALVKRAAEKHDVVIVSFHGGAEGAHADHVPVGKEMYLKENRGDLRTFTHAVIDAGADLVIGHGPHVLRGMELYQGRLIAYSLGNFATYGRFNLAGAAGVGAILEAEVASDGSFVSGKIIATHQVEKGLPRLDSKNRAVSIIQKLSIEDFKATAPRILADGKILVP